MDEWKNFLREGENDKLDSFPKVSIVIPTCNSAQNIDLTLESLLGQKYLSFEIIVIDAESKDRTLEIVKSYRSALIRIYTATDSSRYEILNKGITLSRGFYLNFLFPGDYYIGSETLHLIMSLALKENLPELVYCGCLIRDGRSDVKLLNRPLTIDLLKRGLQPTNLESCWFTSKVFKRIGKFDPQYNLRGGLDLLCRLVQEKDFKVASSNRILTDYDLHGVTRQMIVRHFFETMQILYKYFGLCAVLTWLVYQKDVWRYLKLLYRSFKTAILGR